mgnify:CR=1 FL=1
MSLFKKFRNSEKVKFQDDEFTLFEPSALHRTLHLQRVEKASENGKFEEDDDGNPVISLDVLRVNLETSVDLISICLIPGIEGVSLDELRNDLLENANKEVINALYPVAERLAYPVAPDDVENPKQDPALDSATD